jgi:hypothetical protein
MSKIVTFNHISVDITNVTPEQIGACHKVFGPDNQPFYLVENSKGELDQDGQLIEYRVSFTKGMGFQCTCKAGQEGFAHCRSFCWHVRASVACDEEIKQAMKEQERLNAEQAVRQVLYRELGISYSDVDTDTLKRMARRNAQPAPARQCISGRGFSFLK